MSLPALWLCVDLGHSPAPELLARTRDALRAGPAVLWLRSPQAASARELLRLAQALVCLGDEAGAPLFVGDRADVALAIGARGVHLPERSFDPRALAEWPLLRSRAVHDPAGVGAHAAHVEALLASPWGTVAGKSKPLGDKGLRALIELAGRTPVIALGGITGAAEVRACLGAGARGVAVRRALLEADDCAAACAVLQQALAELTVASVPCEATGR